jgi:EAL domain-containing protein (putative c-di-GMP-specific phosphodiesterase class I)/GGDEF domain-containing protein
LWAKEDILWLTDNFQQKSFSAPLPTLKESHRLAPGTLVNSIRFSPELYPESLNPSPDPYWYRIQLAASFNDSEVRRFILHFDSHILRQLDVYLFNGQRLIKHQSLGLLAQTGRDAETGLSYQGPNFQFDIEHGQHLTLLIRKYNDGPSIAPITLYSPTAYQDFVAKQSLFWGAAIAVLLVLALYNAFVFALNPGKTYLWYLLFHSITFVYFAALHGYGFLLWPAFVQHGLAQSIMPLNVLLVWIAVQFAREFLITPIHCTKWHPYLKWFHAITPPALVATIIFPEYATIPFFAVYQSLTSVLAVVLAVTAIRNGFRPARYYFLSWLFVLTGAAIGMATFTSQLPANFWTLHGFFIGSVCELLLLSIALADRLRYAEKKAITKAYIDPQRQLPNYSFFVNEFSHHIYQKQQEHPSLALVIFDTLNYQQLVGFLGPNILEPVYRTHISRLRKFLSRQDWAVAFEQPNGEQDYFVLLPGDRLLILIKDDQQLEDRMQALWSHCSKPLKVQEFEVTLEIYLAAASVGGEAGQNLMDVYRNLQIALLHCEQHQQPWTLYHDSQALALKEHLSLLTDLKQAIHDQRLAFKIQPQFDLFTQELSGGEILVRWSHDSRGAVNPETFIALAEQTGLITKITQHIIEYAFHWFTLQGSVPPHFSLAINLSVHDLQDESILTFIEQQLTHYEINPHQITFEITESSMIGNASRSLTIIQRLQSMGFAIAIDDFGTGYSSLSYLQQIRADKIKIDQTFVRGIQYNKTNHAIVRSIIELAHSINATTIAEGIETADELMYLKSLNCAAGQGSFWSHPLTPESFSERYFSKKELTHDNDEPTFDA